MLKRILFVLLVGAFAAPLTSCQRDREVGGECRDDLDCNDECIEDWPGGFCTVRCRDNRDCPGSTVCIDTRGGVCLFECDDRDECRDRLGGGYECKWRDAEDDRDEYKVCVD